MGLSPKVDQEAGREVSSGGDNNQQGLPFPDEHFTTSCNPQGAVRHTPHFKREEMKGQRG